MIDDNQILIDKIIDEVIDNLFKTRKNNPNTNFKPSKTTNNSDPPKKQTKSKTNEILNIPTQFQTKNSNNLRIYCNNIRGFSSKKQVLEKIINDLECDLLIITETHCSGTQVPKIPNFRSFHRNREVRAKGGLCVFVREELARECIQLWSGDAENEVIAVSFPVLEPRLIVVASYGTQQNTFGPGVTEVHVQEIMGRIQEWVNEGARVVWAGDQNLSIGTEFLPGNDICINPAGKLFNTLTNRYNLIIANNFEKDPTTHIDLKSKKAKALDLVVSNVNDNIQNFTIDHSLNFTPFLVRKSKSSKF